MLFDITFEVVEIRENGVRVTHYLKGSRRAVKKDIENIKKNVKDYMMVGKNGMIVLV